MDKYIGKKLDGRYEIRELIGVGGMANVYKAFDVSTGRIVAVKILREEFMNNEEFLRRFRNESRAISLLSHPNIVKVFDVIFSNRLQSIVMEFIDGITLKDYIEQEGVIRWQEAVHFTVQILRALQHAHDKGIVHRDIKPQNIMLLSDGTIKIADFGIARFSRSNSKTITDKAIGSVHYISPEQASGANTDARTDLYSLGVLLFEMLTGKLPFEADSPVSVAIKQIQSQPNRPRSINPSIPKGLEEIVMKAMLKDMTKRYQSAAEMLRDLEDFKRDPSIVFEYQYLSDPVQPHIAKAAARITQQPSGGQGGEPQGRAGGKNRKQQQQPPQGEERKPLPVVPVLAGIAFAFLLAAGAFITMLFVIYKPFEQVQNVAAPDLVGLNYENIKKQYSASNSPVKLKVESSGPSSEYDEGLIYEQDPPSGKMVKEGSTVKIKVSTGKEVITMEDYRGRDSTEVFRDLSSKKIEYLEQSTYNNDVPKGMVVKTAPSAGEELGSGDVVTVFVSLGAQNQNVEVPLVEGVNFHEAKNLLTTYRLRIECVDEIDQEDDDKGRQPGTIVSQSPNADALVPAGTTINVVVVGGEGWEDPNKKRPIEIVFDLPQGREDRVHLQTVLNGEVVREGNPPPSQTTWKTTPEGKGEGKIQILIDGEVYKTYDVNFDTGVAVETTGMEDTGQNLATQQGGGALSSDDGWEELDGSTQGGIDYGEEPQPVYPDVD